MREPDRSSLHQAGVVFGLVGAVLIYGPLYLAYAAALRPAGRGVVHVRRMILGAA